MKTHYLIVGLLCGAMPLLYSCNNDDTPSLEEPTATTISLSLASVGTGAEISRANPTKEYGYANENEINSALVVIYNAPINSATGKILKVISLSSSDLTYINTKVGETLTPQYGSDQAPVPGGVWYVSNAYSASSVSMDGFKEKGYCYAMAFANVPSTLFSTSTSWAEFKNAIYTQTLYASDKTGQTKPSIAGYGDFVMSAINEVKFSAIPVEGVITISDTDHPLMVQRLAARIDISFGNITPESIDKIGTKISDSSDEVYEVYYNTTTQKYTFPVYDENLYQATPGTYSQITNAYFELTALSLSNVVTSGEYVLEHSDGTPAILGNEKWESGVCTQLVQSYGSRTISSTDVNVLANIEWAKKKTDNYFILGYVGENTYDPEAESPKLTSIKLSGKTNCQSAHFTGTSVTTDDNGYYTISDLVYPIRHNIEGGVDAKLYYGVVRNTIYRLKVRFFASSDALIVRWYWYNDSKGNGNNFTEEAYTVTINKNIIENETGSTND